MPEITIVKRVWGPGGVELERNPNPLQNYAAWQYEFPLRIPVTDDNDDLVLDQNGFPEFWYYYGSSHISQNGIPELIEDRQFDWESVGATDFTLTGWYALSTTVADADYRPTVTAYAVVPTASGDCDILEDGPILSVSPQDAIREEGRSVYTDEWPDITITAKPDEAGVPFHSWRVLRGSDNEIDGTVLRIRKQDGSGQPPNVDFWAVATYAVVGEITGPTITWPGREIDSGLDITPDGILEVDIPRSVIPDLGIVGELGGAGWPPGPLGIRFRELRQKTGAGSGGVTSHEMKRDPALDMADALDDLSWMIRQLARSNGQQLRKLKTALGARIARLQAAREVIESVQKKS